MIGTTATNVQAALRHIYIYIYMQQHYEQRFKKLCHSTPVRLGGEGDAWPVRWATGATRTPAGRPAGSKPRYWPGCHVISSSGMQPMLLQIIQ